MRCGSVNYTETSCSFALLTVRAVTRLLEIALVAVLLTTLFVAKAGRARFEHATVWLKARRSARLSYRPCSSLFWGVPVKRFFLDRRGGRYSK